MDLPGLAIKDYFNHSLNSKLYIHDEFGPKVEMPVSDYFRSYRQMPELEKEAILNCKGRVLDIGAGAGSHALTLQEKGFDITALEISQASCSVMKRRGVEKVICDDFFNFKSDKPFDTLLLLMNGIGLCSTIEKLRLFLSKAKTLLKKDGQLLFDSCDISYMYEDIGYPERYYGEIKCSYEYNKHFTDWFYWLYIDPKKLTEVATTEGWECEILLEDDKSQYLAKLTY